MSDNTIRKKFINALNYHTLHLFSNNNYQFKNHDYKTALEYYISTFLSIQNNNKALNNRETIYLITVLSCYTDDELKNIDIDYAVDNSKHNLDKMKIRALIILLNIYKNKFENNINKLQNNKSNHSTDISTDISPLSPLSQNEMLKLNNKYITFKINNLELKIMENINENDLLYVDEQFLWKYITKLKYDNHKLKHDNRKLKYENHELKNIKL